MSIDRHDIEGHRGIAVGFYSKVDFARRILWGVVGPLFRGSPRHLYAWRNFMLRRFGAEIGRGVRIYPSVRVFAPWKLTVGDECSIAWDVKLYDLAPITIGSRCIVSQGAHLCAGNHDYRQPHLPFTNKPIVVEDDVWICADAFVGSGVTVGRLAVVGARTVVTKNVPPRAVVAGNPARQVAER